MKAAPPEEAHTTEALERLVAVARSRAPLGGDDAAAPTRDPLAPGEALYTNRNQRLNIEFRVQRLAFPHLQTMDPRVVRIAPGKNNELHRHAHESLFVVLAGQGEVRVGEAWTPLHEGEVAFVP
ncbi:MAG TPA: cupin domain-containing protein, partial [Vicinamibacteria bacterium]|nr:cupin domain-containing protein [Vicinamibacteria bacterium]